MAKRRPVEIIAASTLGPSERGPDFLTHPAARLSNLYFLTTDTAVTVLLAGTLPSRLLDDLAGHPVEHESHEHLESRSYPYCRSSAYRPREYTPDERPEKEHKNCIGAVISRGDSVSR